MDAAKQCSADLGETFASTACIDAVEASRNKALVTALGDQACTRARLDAATPDIASSACELARARAERAAWLQIETAAQAGTQPNLDLDQLVPGLPKVVARASSNGDATAALPIQSGTTEYLDARFSFRDVPLESAPAKDMRLVEDRGDAKVYVRDTESMTIGDGKLSSVNYQFWHYKLERVTLNTDGVSNSQAMLRVFQKTYGPGYQPGPSLVKWLWQGHRASGEYDENPKSGSAMASIWSNELKQEEERGSAKAQH